MGVDRGFDAVPLDRLDGLPALRPAGLVVRGRRVSQRTTPLNRSFRKGA